MPMKNESISNQQKGGLQSKSGFARKEKGSNKTDHGSAALSRCNKITVTLEFRDRHKEP